MQFKSTVGGQRAAAGAEGGQLVGAAVAAAIALCLPLATMGCTRFACYVGTTKQTSRLLAFAAWCEWNCG